MTANKHTPGPWHSGFTKFSQVFAENGALIARCNRLTSLTNLQANARLIAAAPEYNGAVQAIYAACESNAAPVNLMDALRELDLQGKRISLDADLLIDLFNAHAKATRGAA